MWVVRLFGCVLITGCFGILGITKANALFKRVKTIDSFIKFVNDTAEEIRLSCDDIPEIFKKVLPKGVEIYNEKLIFSYDLYAEPEEKQVLENFISGAGMSESSAVWRRCVYYRQKLEEIRYEAKLSAQEKNKLYKTMGFLAGFVLSFLWW